MENSILNKNWGIAISIPGQPVKTVITDKDFTLEVFQFDRNARVKTLDVRGITADGYQREYLNLIAFDPFKMAHFEHPLFSREAILYEKKTKRSK